MFYCEIISGLWIGDIDIMLTKKFIQDNNITMILNCTTGIDFPAIDIQKVRIPLSERIEDDLHLLKINKDKILELLLNSLDTHNILVCCYDGKNISPFIVSLLLIKYGGIKKETIRDIMRTKHTSITMDYDISMFDI